MAGGTRQPTGQTQLEAGGTGRVAGAVPFSAVDGPGNRYVLFLQGCRFDCLACHNPATIPLRPRGSHPQRIDEVLVPIVEAAPFLTGVTVAGGEPTCQPEVVHELFTRLAADPRTERLTRFLDTNGDAPPEVWQRLLPVTDGVMVDLKALDDAVHLVLTGSSNVRVLAAIRELATRGPLYEVRLLLVPGLNDSDRQLARTAAWLHDVDPAIRVRVNPFRRTGTRACARDLREPGADDLLRYRTVLSGNGITHLAVPRPPSPGP